MSKKIGFGIVGCGVISKWHIAAINEIEDAELIGVYDSFADGARRLGEEYSCRVFDTYEDMLSCDEIDAVNICTPSGTHASLAIHAANHGKNIVVEKPMAITKEQITDLIDAVEKNGVKATVISQLRFRESVQKLKTSIDNGDLGKLLVGDIYMKYFRSQEYYDSGAWRGTVAMDGGGALMNQGIHGIDLLQYLVGPVCSVMSMCKTVAHDIEVEDVANVIVEFQNGALGVIQGTTCVEPGYPRIIQISGTNGTVELTEDVITTWDVSGDVSFNGDKVFNGNEGFRNHMSLESDSHVAQIKDFIEAIRDNRKPLVDVYEAKKPIEIILAAYESSISGKKILL